MNMETIGDKIANEFSRDKVYLTDAERRRLASMIDTAWAEEVASIEGAKQLAYESMRDRRQFEREHRVGM
jgi:hypothetical protein